MRIPSLVFFCLALPAVALVVRELVGDEGAAGAVLLLAASPIPVLYATFGRPHTLLFAWLMWGTFLALRAARSGSTRWWIFAGAFLGLAVFVHPTAPLYAITVGAASLVYAPRPVRTLVREAWPGAFALLIAFVPYYLRTLHVLGDRYGVGTAKAGGRTFSGRPVWEDALHFLAPGRHDINYFTAFAVVGAAALVVAHRSRVLAFCAVTVAGPVLFFSFVPANGDSALFFDRYMIPATPAFLAVVCAGCLAIARWSDGLRLLVFGILVAGLLGIELRYDNGLRDGQQRIGLERVTGAVAAGPRGAVLFGSTGTSGASFSSFDYGHPANLLDRYVALRVGSLDYVDDDSCERALAFIQGSPSPRTGEWLFYAAAPEEVASGREALARVSGARSEQVGSGYFLARSARPLPPRSLVALGQSLRLAWRSAVPLNRRVNELLQADRQLLRRPPVCTPYGELGDPAISPHWPPVKTTHQ
ncbi:MAG: glycosyltransferase family 39 protein [Actinobacteria bacterium]|nr:glycosyltransferase family 39 protein [Actinomycetota bacterium]